MIALSDSATARSATFLWLHAKSQLKLKYRHAYLGYLWNLIEPALYLAVLSVIFSVVNRMNINDYAVYLFSALVPWRYYERTTVTMMESIVGGDWLLKKLPVSAFVFPLSRWLIASVEFLWSFLVVLLIFLLIKTNWTVHLIAIPAAVLLWGALGLGTGLICSVVFVFFRDMRPVVQMLLMFVFFSSPILFKADLFAEHSLQVTLLTLHPITYYAAVFQKPLYYGAWPSLADWGVCSMISTLSLLVGYCLLKRMERRLYYYL
jgi:ABC-type polysaccharide/polyol phosphate export permease